MKGKKFNIQYIGKYARCTGGPLLTADFVNEAFFPTPCGYIEHTLSGFESSEMKKKMIEKLVSHKFGK